MTEIGLNAMRRGGIFDHVGYGFHRYSTDAGWLLPHFEKMLYDQAMISLACLEAHQATGDERYGRIASEIFTYVLRDMTAPDGGFYSAEDADSEGEEGKFYLWTEEELRFVLEGDEADLVVKLFDVRREGNFKEEATGRFTGKNVLHLKGSVKDLARELKISEFDLIERLETARKKLFSARENRIRPSKDDKILADWNGLMIASLARGAQVLGEKELEEAASRAADFILEKMRDDEGRLLHRYREGSAGILANLDDYAFLIWGLVELYEAGFGTKYLRAAQDLARDLVRRFEDEEGGGFYFTPEDGEDLILRKKEAHDGALPSGNAVAVLDLLRLARMTGDSKLEEIASKAFEAFAAQARGVPQAHLHLLSALDFALGPASEVVIAGPADSPETQKMLKALRSKFLPRSVVLLRPEGEVAEIIGIAEFAKEMEMVDGKATAYVCSGSVCQRPTTDPEEMLARLDLTAGGS